MSSQAAGFPPGIHPGGLVQRALAHLIDLVPAILLILGAAAAYVWGPGTGARIALTVICLVLVAGWLVLLWWMFATRGAGVGMRVMHLELVGVENGQPIGGVRTLIRMLVFAALSATSVGLIVMLVLMTMNLRRQGWHDLAARSVVIEARQGAAASRPQVPTHAAPPARTGAPVGLPPALQGRSASPFAAPQDLPAIPGAFGPGMGPPSGHLQHPGGHVQQPGGRVQQSQQSGGQQGDPGAGQRSALAPPVGEPPLGQPVPGAAPIRGVPSFAAPPPASSGPPLSRAVEEEVESTRLVPSGTHRHPPDQGWAVMLGDGRLVEVASLLLLGRNPHPRAGEEGAALIQISDSSRTVSKTHLAVGVDHKGIYVMDRGSTNGSAIVTSAGTFEPCAPGDQVRVREGQVVSFGEQRLEIRRTYSS